MEVVMKKKVFSVFPKTLSNGKVVFYYTVYDEHGKRRQFSTGKLCREEAIVECCKRLSEGKIVPKSKLLFKEYVKDWFINGICPYYSIREVKGRLYSKSSIDNKRLTLNKHLLPFFGELKMSYITTQLIENWIKLKKDQGYAVNSINRFISILSLILNEAVRTGYIDKNPCKSVINFTELKKREGYIFFQRNWFVI